MDAVMLDTENWWTPFLRMSGFQRIDGEDVWVGSLGNFPVSLRLKRNRRNHVVWEILQGVVLIESYCLITGLFNAGRFSERLRQDNNDN